MAQSCLAHFCHCLPLRHSSLTTVLAYSGGTLRLRGDAYPRLVLCVTMRCLTLCDISCLLALGWALPHFSAKHNDSGWRRLPRGLPVCAAFLSAFPCVSSLPLFVSDGTLLVGGLNAVLGHLAQRHFFSLQRTFVDANGRYYGNCRPATT